MTVQPRKRQIRRRFIAFRFGPLDSEFHVAALFVHPPSPGFQLRPALRDFHLRQGYGGRVDGRVRLRYTSTRQDGGQGSGDYSPHLARFQFFILPSQKSSEIGGVYRHALHFGMLNNVGQPFIRKPHRMAQNNL
jgi:hypothetical protein